MSWTVFSPTIEHHLRHFEAWELYFYENTVNFLIKFNLLVLNQLLNTGSYPHLGYKHHPPTTLKEKVFAIKLFEVYLRLEKFTSWPLSKLFNLLVFKQIPINFMPKKNHEHFLWRNTTSKVISHINWGVKSQFMKKMSNFNTEQFYWDWTNLIIIVKLLLNKSVWNSWDALGSQASKISQWKFLIRCFSTYFRAVTFKRKLKNGLKHVILGSTRSVFNREKQNYRRGN
jgi:hypothetical protein